MGAKRRPGLALSALLVSSCGGGGATGPTSPSLGGECAAFDAALVSARARRSDGQLERAVIATSDAIAACPARAHEARPLLLAELTEIGRLDEARALAAEIARDSSATASEREAAQRVPAAPSKAVRGAELEDTSDAEKLLAKEAASEALTRADAIWSRQPWHARAALVGGYAAAALGDRKGARTRFDRALVAFEESTQHKAVRVNVRVDDAPITVANIPPAKDAVLVVATPIRSGDAAPARVVGKARLHGRAVHVAEVDGAAEVIDARGRALGRIPRFNRYIEAGDWLVASDARATVVFDRALREHGRVGTPLPANSRWSVEEGGHRVLETTDDEARVLALPSLETVFALREISEPKVFWRQNKLAVLAASEHTGALNPPTVDVYDLRTGKRKARAEVNGLGFSFTWTPNFGMDLEGNRLGFATDETVVVDLRTGKRVTLDRGGELLGGDPYAQSSEPSFTEDGKHVCFKQFGRTRIVPPERARPGTTTHCVDVAGRAVIAHLALPAGRKRLPGSVGHMSRVFPEATSRDGKLVAVFDVETTTTPSDEAAFEGPFAGGHAHLAVFRVADGARVADIDLGTLGSAAALEVRFVGDDAVGVAGADGGGTYRIATGERVGAPPPFSYEDGGEISIPKDRPLCQFGDVLAPLEVCEDRLAP